MNQTDPKESDRQLIIQAYNSDEWSDVADLKNKAQTEGARLILHDRMIHLYRKEEYSAGLQ